MKKSILVYVSLLLVSLFLFISCNENRVITGSVVIKAQMDETGLGEISYKVSGQSENLKTVEKNFKKGEEVKFDNLNAGKWTFTVEAFNDIGLVGSGESNVEVKPEKVENLIVDVKLITIPNFTITLESSTITYGDGLIASIKEETIDDSYSVIWFLGTKEIGKAKDLTVKVEGEDYSIGENTLRVVVTKNGIKKEQSKAIVINPKNIIIPDFTITVETPTVKYGENLVAKINENTIDSSHAVVWYIGEIKVGEGPTLNVKVDGDFYVSGNNELKAIVTKDGVSKEVKENISVEIPQLVLSLDSYNVGIKLKGSVSTLSGEDIPDEVVFHYSNVKKFVTLDADHSFSIKITELLEIDGTEFSVYVTADGFKQSNEVSFDISEDKDIHTCIAELLSNVSSNPTINKTTKVVEDYYSFTFNDNGIVLKGRNVWDSVVNGENPDVTNEQECWYYWVKSADDNETYYELKTQYQMQPEMDGSGIYTEIPDTRRWEYSIGESPENIVSVKYDNLAESEKANISLFTDLYFPLGEADTFSWQVEIVFPFVQMVTEGEKNIVNFEMTSASGTVLNVQKKDDNFVAKINNIDCTLEDYLIDSDMNFVISFINQFWF